MEKEKAEDTIDMDVNSNEFYSKIQHEMELDLARLKMNVQILRDLKIAAAEMEIETAALYHAELLKNIEEFEAVNKQYEEDVVNDNSEIDLTAS